MGLDMYLSIERYVSPHQVTMTPMDLVPGMTAYKFDAKPAIETVDYPQLLDASGLAELIYDEDSSGITVSVCCAYWRKANAIHHWFVNRCCDGRDDCEIHPVERHMLQQLRDTAAKAHAAYLKGDTDTCKTLLPPTAGFFFGGTDIDEWYAKDLEYTVSRLTKILEHPAAAECDFTYRASW